MQLTDGKFVAQGEGLSVHYLGDTTERMCEQIEAAREAIEAESTAKHSCHCCRQGARAMRSTVRYGISKRSDPARASLTGIEQPLPRGVDESLDGYRSPVPLSADESCQHRGELEATSRRYQILNIKLDKAGGLTEALLLAQAARQKRMQVLVGNMGGTSLSMASAFVLAQLCDYVKLDGPFVLRSDRLPALAYRDGHLEVPDPRLWG